MPKKWGKKRERGKEKGQRVPGRESALYPHFEGF